ncbi:major facilitator superfamily domain-containing protein 6-like isoform X1 [Ptychodera flava]|uniref:major facilitator superfamily domain-containing protein 6-like isoform X1 n=1 Tax=Ptychodera flava TaxID=63121 RepID=UPI003969DD67
MAEPNTYIELSSPAQGLSAQTQLSNETTRRRSNILESIRVNPSLIPYKVFCFCYGGAVGALVPYLPIFYKSLGFNPKQIGLLVAAKVITQFVCDPLMSAVADKLNKRKLVLLIALVSSIVAMGTVWIVPGVVTKKATNCSSLRRHINFSLPQKEEVTYVWHSDKPFVADTPSEDFFKRLDEDKPKNVTSGDTFPPIRAYTGYRNYLVSKADSLGLFHVLLLVIFCGHIFASPVESLNDTAVLQALGDQTAKIGLQKVWMVLPSAILGVLSGASTFFTTYVTITCGISLAVPSFAIPFTLYVLLLLLALLVVLAKYRFQDSVGSRQHHPLYTAITALCTPHYIVILLAALVTGLCDGVIDTFLLWYIEELGGTQLLLGITKAVSYLSDVIFYFASYKMIAYIGQLWFLLLGLGCLIIRFVLYSQIFTPWAFMFGELLSGVTSAACQVALVSYFAKGVQASSLATLQGVIHGIYAGLGTGTGSALGGLFVMNHGVQVTFVWFSYFACIALVFLFFGHKLIKKPEERRPADDRYEEIAGRNVTREPSKGANNYVDKD